MTKIRKHYQPSPRYHQEIDPASGRTHQSFKDECDINNLVEQWLRTGVAQFTERTPTYSDVSELPDADTARRHMAYAEQQFDLLSDADKDEYKTPLAYFEALHEAAENLGTENSLVVTVPSDTTPPTQTSQEGDESDETHEDQQTKKQAPVHKNSTQKT